MTLVRPKKALAKGWISAHWSLVRPCKSLVPEVGLSDLSSPATMCVLWQENVINGFQNAERGTRQLIWVNQIQSTLFEHTKQRPSKTNNL